MIVLNYLLLLPFLVVVIYMVMITFRAQEFISVHLRRGVSHFVNKSAGTSRGTVRILHLVSLMFLFLIGAVSLVVLLLNMF